LAYSIIPMAVERSFWHTLLFLRRYRGRFGILYYSYGGRDVVLVYSIIPTVAERSFCPILLFLRRRRGRFGLLYYFYGGGVVALAYSLLSLQWPRGRIA